MSGHKALALLFDTTAPARRLVGIANHVRWNAEKHSDVRSAEFAPFQPLCILLRHGHRFVIKARFQDHDFASASTVGTVILQRVPDILDALRPQLRVRPQDTADLCAVFEDRAAMLLHRQRQADCLCGSAGQDGLPIAEAIAAAIDDLNARRYPVAAVELSPMGEAA